MSDEPNETIISVAVASGPLGERPVTFDLSSKRTILVGRNSAGKSLILQALTRSAQQTQKPAEAPISFRCVVGPGPSLGRFSYKYQVDVDGSGTDARLLWCEECRDLEHQRVLWSVSHGKLVVGKEVASVSLPPNTGLLALDNFEGMPPEARLLKKLLHNAQLVPAGIPRTREFVVTSSKFKNVTDRDYRLVSQLVAAEGTPTMEEFQGVLEDMQLARKVVTQKLQVGKDTIAIPIVDDVPFGYLSDGTQRLIEIIWFLVAFPDSLLCIEEPETAVHPGVLVRLLNTMKSYASDRQIILSSHSPFLVDHIDPFELRLVERSKGQTTARSLGPEESKNVSAYLCDEGTLGEYLFGFLSHDQDESDGDEDEDRDTR